MGEVATIKQGAVATQQDNAAIKQALMSSLYPGAREESVDMVLSYCRAGGLDPMTKPVHIVPMSVKDAQTGNYTWRDVVMPGIELYRTKAHRTSEYAGQDRAEFGPTVTSTLQGKTVNHPESCTVTVYRLAGGQRVPYSATAYWLETYATAGKDTEAPNAMWRKRPFGQIEKCAEALALRKAFPEAVGAQPTAEEMEGRTIETHNIAEPQSQKRLELSAYPDDLFDQNFDVWCDYFRRKQTTAERLIGKLSTKGTLSDEQLQKIRDAEEKHWGADVEQETATTEGDQE